MCVCNKKNPTHPKQTQPWAAADRQDGVFRPHNFFLLRLSPITLPVWGGDGASPAQRVMA